MKERAKRKKPPLYEGFLFPRWSRAMPKVVKTLPAAKGRTPGATKYDPFLDGQVYKFSPKELEDWNAKTLKSGLYRVARLKKLRVVFREEEDCLFVQALPAPTHED